MRLDQPLYVSLFFALTSSEFFSVMSVDLSLLTYMKKGMGVVGGLEEIFDEDINAAALLDTGKMPDNKPECLLLKSPDPDDKAKYGIYQSIVSLAKASGIDFDCMNEASRLVSHRKEKKKKFVYKASPYTVYHSVKEVMAQLKNVRGVERAQLKAQLLKLHSKPVSKEALVYFGQLFDRDAKVLLVERVTPFVILQGTGEGKDSRGDLVYGAVVRKEGSGVHEVVPHEHFVSLNAVTIRPEDGSGVAICGPMKGHYIVRLGSQFRRMRWIHESKIYLERYPTICITQMNGFLGDHQFKYQPLPVSQCVKYPQVIKDRYDASLERWKDANQAAAAPPNDSVGVGNEVADISKMEVAIDGVGRSDTRNLLSPLTTCNDFTLKPDGTTQNKAMDVCEEELIEMVDGKESSAAKSDNQTQVQGNCETAVVTTNPSLTNVNCSDNLQMGHFVSPESNKKRPLDDNHAKKDMHLMKATKVAKIPPSDSVCHVVGCEEKKKRGLWTCKNHSDHKKKICVEAGCSQKLVSFNRLCELHFYKWKFQREEAIKYGMATKDHFDVMLGLAHLYGEGENVITPV